MKGKEGYVMCLLLGHVLNMFTAKQRQFCLLVLDGCWLQYAVVVGGCVCLSQHLVSALTMATVTVISVNVNVTKFEWRQTWRLHDKGAL